MPKPIDVTTRKWIRNKSDELAAANGCRFDAAQGKFVVDWIEGYCFLYEGVPPGTKMELRDWQREAVMRIFGWVKDSVRWKRSIRRFRRASIWVPKKNKKSPTLAAIGLYLLMGDDEQGQKVFSCARDGKQALISHTHAMEMIRRSPELNAACTINKSTGRITHEETRSFFSIISGDNIEGQEGLNGSVLVDETHVVDARLMKVLEYAGASRSEPLQIEVSTAGNNPDGYGKSQFDHGMRVEKGETDDETFFFLNHSAPQDLADDDLEKNLITFGKQANPAWGHTIDEVEFTASYNKAKKSIASLLDFKMYRLNIWQRAANPWLRSSDWAQCKTVAASDFEGADCNAGLDLSRVSDMTALVMSFDDTDDPEGVVLIPKFWLPDAYAKLNGHLAPFLDWARDGWLKLTPGSVMDYGYLKADIRDLSKRFNIQRMFYDEMYAEELTQNLADGTTDNKGVTLEEGIGFERVAFKQNIMSFAKPTDDFESLVISHKLKHDGNPILTWMAGHCEVYRDANGNKRPIKPDAKKGGLKKIDGIVAGIMALAARSGDDAMRGYDGKVFTVGG